MRFFGGKARICKEVAKVVNDLADDMGFDTIYEPFCGGLCVTQWLKGKVLASDVSQPLITLYKAVQGGWTPPDVVTEEMYRDYAKRRPVDDPMTAFIGHGCSFGGKWFGGYARDAKKGNYALKAKDSIIKKFSNMGQVSFSCGGYLEIDPHNAIIYCDPPYDKTTQPYVGEFNTDEFWQMADVWTRAGNLVLVSEYQAPADALCLWERKTTTAIRGSEGKVFDRIEKIFTVTGNG